jgi:hypothetical protein
MTTDNLTTDSQPDNASQHQPSEPQYKRVTAAEAAKMWRLRQEGLTHNQLATVTGRSLETISRQLAQFEDTRDEARNYLNGKALDAAMRLDELASTDENSKVRLDATKAILQSNKLLGNEEKTQVVGIQVVLGLSVTSQQLSPYTEQPLSDTGVIIEQ